MQHLTHPRRVAFPILSAVVAALSFFGPIWFSYWVAIAIIAVAVAIFAVALAGLVGDSRHRWGPVTPMRDCDHEFDLQRGAEK